MSVRESCKIGPSARNSSKDIFPESNASTVGIISSRWDKSICGDNKSNASLAAEGVASQLQTPPERMNSSSSRGLGRLV